MDPTSDRVETTGRVTVRLFRKNGSGGASSHNSRRRTVVLMRGPWLARRELVRVSGSVTHWALVEMLDLGEGFNRRSGVDGGG
jgi:hypothetical protein